LNIPTEIWKTRYNLAEVRSRLAQYDQALAHYLRALQVSRDAGDNYGVAITSYGMGTLFREQGRYGAALGAMDEALKIFQELEDQSLWMGEILAGYGNALSLVGQGSKAQPALTDALKLAQELKSDSLVARALNFQGDDFFYRGDFKQQAQRAALRTSDPHLILTSKINLAKVDVKQGRLQRATKALRGLAQEAQTLRLKYLSLQASLYLAEALVNSRNYARAQQELESSLRMSQDAGLRALRAKSHYLLATALRLSGKQAEARRHYTEALQVAREIRQEAGSDQLMNRADLSAIFTESTHWSTAPPA
jgi:tetratricopeptide (TPR) repeat protein